MPNSELKPCPFCGSEPFSEGNGFHVRISCSNRDCMISPRTPWVIRLFNHKPDYIIWNTRKGARDGKTNPPKI